MKLTINVFYSFSEELHIILFSVDFEAQGVWQIVPFMEVTPFKNKFLAQLR